MITSEAEFNHTGTSKTNQGFGFSNHHITHKGKTRTDAAHGGVGLDGGDGAGGDAALAVGR